MVTNVTSFSRSGLSDFLIQRFSAVILGLYALCLVSFFVVNPNVTHGQLVSYFSSTSMVVFSTLAIGSFAAHAWIGMWTIGTDYIGEHYFGARALVTRFIYQTLCLMALFLYVMWGASIVWGIA